MRKHIRIPLFLRLMAFVAMLALTLTKTCASEFSIPFTDTPPTIDGVISGDSGWQDASVRTLAFKNEANPGTTHEETVYMVHDGTWLYIGVQSGFGTGWDVWFGVYTDGNNNKVLDGTASHPVRDVHVSLGSVSAWGGYNHYSWLGTGTWGYTDSPAGTAYVSLGQTNCAYEYKILLSDMDQAPGGRFGIWLTNGTNGTSTGQYSYPTSDYSTPDQWSEAYLEVPTDCLASGNWTKNGHDIRNTSRSTAKGPSSAMLKWKAHMPTYYIMGSPALDPSGNVYVPTSENTSDGIARVYKLNGANGSQIWEYSVLSSGLGVKGGVCLTRSGHVLFGGDDGTATELDANGARLWNRSIGGGPSAHPPTVGPDGNRYVTHGPAGIFKAISPDGTVLWTKQLASYPSQYPAIGSDGTVYVGAASFGTPGSLYAFAPDGTQKWSAPVAPNPGSSPTILDDGSIAIGTRTGYIVCVDSTGAERWRTPESLTTNGPDQCFCYGLALLPNGNVCALVQGGKLAVIDKDSGAIINYTDVGIALPGSVQVAVDRRGFIYIPTPQGIKCFDSECNLKWFYQCEGEVWGGPIISNRGQLFFTTSSSWVYCIKASVMDGHQVGSPYPRLGANFKSTSLGLHNGATNVLKWSRTTGAGWSGLSAIAADGTVFGGASNGVFYALNGENGNVKWQIQTGGPVGTAAIAKNGWIYFGSNDGKVYAADATNGSIKWTYQTGDQVNSPPIVAEDGTVYAGSDDHCLYALDGTTGALKWRFVSTWRIYGGASIGDDGTVFVAPYDRWVYALNPEDGSIKWQTEIYHGSDYDRTCAALAVGDNGLVYGANLDGDVFALEEETGVIRWMRKVSWRVYASPAIGPDGTVYVNSHDGNVYAFDGLTGSSKWSVPTGGYASIPSVAPDGTVYVGSTSKLMALNGSDGQVKWTWDTGVGVGNILIGADGGLYFAGSDAAFYALKGATAKIPITVEAEPKAKTYGSADPALTYHITNGQLQPGDSFTGSLVRDPGETVGTYAIRQGTLALSDKYELSFSESALSIAKGRATITVSPYSVSYDGEQHLSTGIATGVNGEDLSDLIDLSITLHQDAGSYNDSWSFSGNENYESDNGLVTNTILKKSITVAADSKTKVYGNTDPALTYQITNGDLVQGDSLSGSLARDLGEDVGEYRITQGTLTANNNYDITFNESFLTISKRPITVTANPATKILNGTDPALAYTISEGQLVNGDQLTGQLVRDPGEQVGSYSINKGTLSAGLNYELTYVGAFFRILYAPAGTQCHGEPSHVILQPINVDGSSVFKQKSTVVAKFRVCDVNGVSIGTPGVITSFNIIQIINGTVSDVNEPVDSTTPDSSFRWDESSQQWKFNISTKNLSAGSTYVFRIALNDGTAIDFRFGLR